MEHLSFTITKQTIEHSLQLQLAIDTTKRQIFLHGNIHEFYAIFCY